MTKTIITSAIVGAIVALLCGWLLFGGPRPIFGDASVENYPVIFAQGLRAGFKTVVTAIDNQGAWVSNVSTTKNIVTSGNVTIGAGTPIVAAQCATSSKSIGSLGSNATTTFDVALTGATTSLNQAYWIGNATSSQTGQQLQLFVHPTSTTGYVTVFAQMASTSLTYGGATTTVSVCYIQF